MGYNQNIITWMPEFVRSVYASASSLRKEAERLNKLAERQEQRNREKEQEKDLSGLSPRGYASSTVTKVVKKEESSYENIRKLLK